MYQLNGENSKDNIKRSEFSLSRLIVYKDSSDRLTSNIITYIPDISYIEKGKDIRENTFLQLGSTFTGYIEFKKIDGQPYRLLRIKDGKLIKKYKVSSSSVQNQTRVNSESSASTCSPICTPIFQTICSGPGGPGTGDPNDWVCETQQIGENCIVVCDGGGEFPDPGQGGNPDTPGIFGLNGSNAIVPDSNFGSLVNYVKSRNYSVSDQFSSSLTVDGVSYEGTIVEIYTNQGEVTAAYFHVNEPQGPFAVGYFYAIGEGNGSNTSDWPRPDFILPGITGTNITWTNGTSSPATVSYEAIPNISDDDPEIAMWNDEPNPEYGATAAPSYDAMYANYPKNSTGGDLPAPQVYALVGGDILAMYQSNPVKYGNACALRVSRALNYSGIRIPYIPNQTTSGADGKYYFVSSIHLYNYLKQVFQTTYRLQLKEIDGGPQGNLFREKLKGIKGIFIMQPNYPRKFRAYGHATLWNGFMAIGGHDYFNALGGVARIVVWQLE